jgi:hypothetical protein
MTHLREHESRTRTVRGVFLSRWPSLVTDHAEEIRAGAITSLNVARGPTPRAASRMACRLWYDA